MLVSFRTCSQAPRCSTIWRVAETGRGLCQTVWTLDAVMTKHGNKWQLGDDAEQDWLSSLQILELTRDSIEENQPASDCQINLDRMAVTIRPVDAMAVKREVEEPEWRRKSSRWA